MIKRQSAPRSAIPQYPVARGNLCMTKRVLGTGPPRSRGAAGARSRAFALAGARLSRCTTAWRRGDLGARVGDAEGLGSLRYRAGGAWGRRCRGSGHFGRAESTFCHFTIQS